VPRPPTPLTHGRLTGMAHPAQVVPALPSRCLTQGSRSIEPSSSFPPPRAQPGGALLPGADTTANGHPLDRAQRLERYLDVRWTDVSSWASERPGGAAGLTGHKRSEQLLQFPTSSEEDFLRGRDGKCPEETVTQRQLFPTTPHPRPDRLAGSGGRGRACPGGV
jgi:hypothetical protein